MNKQFSILEITPLQNSQHSSFIEQLFRSLHVLKPNVLHKMLCIKNIYSMEIVSTDQNGIRFLLRLPQTDAVMLKRIILSLLPYAKIQETLEYLPEKITPDKRYLYHFSEFKLQNKSYFMLQKHTPLREFDPIASISSHMSKLTKSEWISLQFVITPIKNRYLSKLSDKKREPIFKTAVRLMAYGNKDMLERMKGIQTVLISSTNTADQSLIAKQAIPLVNKIKLFQNYRFFLFKNRLLSYKNNPVLTVSELASLFHFPSNQSSKTEDVIHIHSKQLPLPHQMKVNQHNFAVTFAKNHYGEKQYPIGLLSNERERHLYIVGATGTGKSTLMYSMISHDIQNGKGLCVIDPHGDLAESVLASIPENRMKDVIYVNPDDLNFPIGLNLLEQTSGLSEDDKLREKEFIAESVISLFRKVFSEAWSAHPHRIEYILRNTIHTAFTMENPTLFTLFDLLQDAKLRNSVVAKLTDEYLKKFWKFEFSRAGSFQQVKMISPITAKIGRFLFSPVAKRILEQHHSTVDIDQCMQEGKIIIADLAKGKLGEDTSNVLGILLLNKIQLAALKRVRITRDKRKDFYLYIDEFQNFATRSFIEMFSEARKFKLHLILAQQSMSQIDDWNMVNIILANVGSIVTFRSANPEDEKRMLTQFSPYVETGEISNLPAYHFYMKISAVSPYPPFSGATIPIDIPSNKDQLQTLIELSRKTYAIKYSSSQQKLQYEFSKTEKATKPKNTHTSFRNTKKEDPGLEAKDDLPDNE